MAESIITVRDVYNVAPPGGNPTVMFVADTLQPGPTQRDDFIEGPYRGIADRIGPRMQPRGVRNSVDFAHSLATEPGFVIAGMLQKPSVPFGFALMCELPPTLGIRPRKEKEYVLWQFGVTWSSRPVPEGESTPTLPERYRRAADCMLDSLLRPCDPLDSIFVVDHPEDTRSDRYFRDVGFTRASQGVVRRLWKTPCWGSGRALLGARVDHVLQTLHSQPTFPERLELRKAQRSLDNCA